MSAMPLPRDAAADRHLVRRVRKALAAKERSELRPAFWAGLTIFVGLPLLWSVLLILLDSKHRALPGIATLLGVCGGWIFAAIVAAQTVCRDFGRARCFPLGLAGFARADRGSEGRCEFSADPPINRLRRRARTGADAFCGSGADHT